MREASPIRPGWGEDLLYGLVSVIIRAMIATIKNSTCFTPAQYEVVNLMSCLADESDIAALKSVLVRFLDARLQKALDKLYDDGTLSDSRMEELASAHLRTPYGVSAP